MTEAHIRAATLDDLNVLLGFQQGVVEAERPFDPTLRPGPLEYYDLAELVAHPQVQLLVATVGTEVVGSGYARIMTAKPYLRHETYAYLGFMYVLPAHRGRGINRQLLAGLREWAHAAGVPEMRLEVYANNAVARQAYEKFGFEPHMLEMRMPV